MNTTPMSAVADSSAKMTRTLKKSKSVPLSYRLMVGYRFILAMVGGYILASLCSVVIAQYFAEYRTSAAMAATLIAFTVHCTAFIWVFMVHKTLKASLGILIPIALLYLTYKMMGN